MDIGTEDWLKQTVWGVSYATISMLLGFTLTRVFKLPSWTTPAISFNNTSALPLLLLESLSATGVLDTLLALPDDTPSAALQRAKSYFLVNAMIGDTLTFGLGPRLLDGDEVSGKQHGSQSKDTDSPKSDDHANGDGTCANRHHQSHGDATEQTSLLPTTVIRTEQEVSHPIQYAGYRGWSYVPKRVQSVLTFAYDFLNPPMTGAIIGAIIGLAPPLHRAFFGNPRNGGIFKAWLTDSIRKIGQLFPALMIFVVGVKLSSSMRKMKRGEDSGNVPWLTAFIVIFIRFFMWPAVSIAMIYLVASRTGWLSQDPILLFCMMLMPTGPSAMKLTALADVSGSSESEKMSVAKFLCLTYALSPLICFTVAGAIKACHAAMALH